MEESQWALDQDLPLESSINCIFAFLQHTPSQHVLQASVKTQRSRLRGLLGKEENQPFYRGATHAKADLLLCGDQKIVKRDLGILCPCYTSTLGGHLIFKPTVDATVVPWKPFPPTHTLGMTFLSGSL